MRVKSLSVEPYHSLLLLLCYFFAFIFFFPFCVSEVEIELSVFLYIQSLNKRYMDKLLPDIMKPINKNLKLKCARKWKCNL